MTQYAMPAASGHDQHGERDPEDHARTLTAFPVESERCYAVCRVAGWSSQVARRAHNPEVAGSNPAPAIRESPGNGAFLLSASATPRRDLRENLRLRASKPRDGVARRPLARNWHAEEPNSCCVEIASRTRAKRSAFADAWASSSPQSDPDPPKGGVLVPQRRRPERAEDNGESCFELCSAHVGRSLYRPGNGRRVRGRYHARGPSASGGDSFLDWCDSQGRDGSFPQPRDRSTP